ncbi:MAG TPA: hypothetical protein P5144_12375, partial [Thermoanaerobaculia bacterium]|nr:hypothetical protein [Thermoanaerobaculia bacterium]
WGWLSADDVRELENLPPLADGAGSAYLQPLNMVPVGEPAAGTAPPPAPVSGVDGAPAPAEGDGERAALRRACAVTVRAAFARFARREERALRRLAERARKSPTGAAGFLEAVAAFYAESEPILRAELEALAEAFAGVWEGEPEAEAREYVAASLEQVRGLVKAEEMGARLDEGLWCVEARAEEWTRTRPDVAARRFEAEEVGQ